MKGDPLMASFLADGVLSFLLFLETVMYCISQLEIGHSTAHIFVSACLTLIAELVREGQAEMKASQSIPRSQQACLESTDQSLY